MKKNEEAQKKLPPGQHWAADTRGGQQVHIPDRFGKRGWVKWPNSSSINRYNWGSCSTGHLTPRCFSGVVQQPAGGSNSQMPEEVGQRVSGKQGKNKSASQLYLDQKQLNAWGFSGRLPNKSGFGIKSCMLNLFSILFISFNTTLYIHFIVYKLLNDDLWSHFFHYHCIAQK